MRLAIALLLLAPGLLPAANPASSIAVTAAHSAVNHGSTTSSPLNCAMETGIAQFRCRHCFQVVFAPIAEETLDEAELSLPCQAPLRPAVRPTLTEASPRSCHPPASQPAFIKFANFRS